MCTKQKRTSIWPKIEEASEYLLFALKRGAFTGAELLLKYWVKGNCLSVVYAGSPMMSEYTYTKSVLYTCLW